MKPIIFNTEMVRAILNGRKTQTRRVCNFTPGGHLKEPRGHRRWHPDDPNCVLACPYGQPGDLLWVRETWAKAPNLTSGEGFVYKANNYPDGLIRWKPSIHMPRWASRIILEIKDIRVERVQDISEGDARAEGDPEQGLIASENCHTEWFKHLWQSINEKRGFGWAVNPWVWVIEFERIDNAQ